MIIQLSKNIILHRTRTLRRRVRWEASVYRDSEWHPLAEVMNTDDMHRWLLTSGCPQSDINLFIQALNSPKVTPAYTRVSKPAPAVSLVPKTHGEEYPQLSRDPVGMFHPEARNG